jgi:hypothetical protein
MHDLYDIAKCLQLVFICHFAGKPLVYIFHLDCFFYSLVVHLKFHSALLCEPTGMQVGNDIAEFFLSHSWRQHHGSLQQQEVLHRYNWIKACQRYLNHWNRLWSGLCTPFGLQRARASHSTSCSSSCSIVITRYILNLNNAHCKDAPLF